MASKKASSASPVSDWMLAASAGEVRGPVATMTLDHAAGGSPSISSRMMVTSGWRSSLCRHLRGEAVAVDRKRAAGRKLVPIGRRQDQRSGPAHLLMQEPDGIRRPVVGAEGVGADELGKGSSLMRFGPALGPHLVQNDRHAGGGGLPGGLASGEPAADHMHRLSHGPS